MYSISIITPVFNEEEIIESSVLKNLRILQKSSLDFEIIIVDDASQDNSLLIIEEISQRQTLTLVKHSENKGFGAAIRSGIEVATKDFIICIPADSPLSDETFHAFIEHLGKADILISYRRKRMGYSKWMLFNSTVYHFLISKLFGMSLKDYNWIHAYHRKIFEDGNITIEYEGIFMLAEVLIKAKRKHYSFIEFPVDQEQRITGVASATRWKTIINTLKDTFHYYFLKSSHL